VNRAEKKITCRIPRARAFAAAAIAATAVLVPLCAEAQSGFHVSQTSKIGGEGSWDYLEYQPSTGRLFIARVGGVLVLDTKSMKPVATIPAFAGTRVHGVALAPDLGLGMTSDGEDETSTIFELATLQPLRRAKLGHAPDGILYDSASRKGVAFDGDDNEAIVFDPATADIVTEIKLPGSPEAGAADGKGHVFVNLSDKGEIATVNTRTWSVEQHWPIGGGCQDPTPLAIDPAHDRIFAGCRSGVLAVLDTVKRTLVTTLPIGQGADSVAYEPVSGLIFVACNDGTLTIVRAISPSRYEVLETVSTAPGARTLALDPEALRVFLPTADKGPLLPKTEELPSRPAIIPETFRILTVTR
jgi:DNA-binding beta-propeller fold protein YncE